MFIINKFGAPCNVNQIFSFAVANDPDHSGYYEVGAYNNSNTLIAQFTQDAPMTEAEATALLEDIQGIVGTISLGTP